MLANRVPDHASSPQPSCTAKVNRPTLAIPQRMARAVAYSPPSPLVILASDTLSPDPPASSDTRSRTPALAITSLDLSPPARSRLLLPTAPLLPFVFLTGSGAGRARALPRRRPSHPPSGRRAGRYPHTPFTSRPPPPPPPAKACLTGGYSALPLPKKNPADKGGQPAPSPKPQATGPKVPTRPQQTSPCQRVRPACGPVGSGRPKHPVRGDGPDFPGAGGAAEFAGGPRESIHPRRGGGARCGNSLPGEAVGGGLPEHGALQRWNVDCPPLFLR